MSSTFLQPATTIDAQVTQPATGAPGADAAVLSQGGSPTEILVGQREARKELRSQLERLQEQRDDIARELRSRSEEREAPTGADRAGLESRLSAIDGRIRVTEQQLAAADAAVAAAAAVPGAVQPEPQYVDSGPPEEVFVLGGMLIVFGVFPLAIAHARRVWKRSAVVATSLPREVWDRFTHLEQSVDAVAVEIERIGEGQRFMTRVFSENTDARIAAVSAHASPADGGDALRRS